MVSDRPTTLAPHVGHHDDDEAALHDTAAILVALHDEGKVPDVTEAATVPPTVGSDRPMTLAFHVVYHDDNEAALHDTAAVLVTLHDEGKLQDVPEAVHEAATVYPTVGFDRPPTLPTRSFITMTTKQLFMTPLPSSSPCTTTAKYRTSQRLLQFLQQSVLIAPRPWLPTSFTTMTTKQLFMTPLPSCTLVSCLRRVSSQSSASARSQIRMASLLEGVKFHCLIAFDRRRRSHEAAPSVATDSASDIVDVELTYGLGTRPGCFDGSQGAN